MSDPVPAGMDMETVLTRAVKKFFKWQLSGVTGTLIVASMLWLLVFFFFFLILVFVMCVEFHYEKRERQDAELALPKDDGKMWAEKRSSRETSNTSLRKIAPIVMPPLPDEDTKPIVISDVPEVEPEPEPEESPITEVTDSVVIVDPQEVDDGGGDPVPEADEEPTVTSPPPPSEPEQTDEPQDEQPADDDNTQDQPAEEPNEEKADKPPPTEEPEAEGEPEPEVNDGEGDGDENSPPPAEGESGDAPTADAAGSPSKSSKKAED